MAVDQRRLTTWLAHAKFKSKGSSRKRSPKLAGWLITLKATHRIYHPLPRLETSEDGNSSAPYVQATGQAGADQQATLRNLFPRRYRFGNGRYSSRGAAAPFAPIKTTGRAATLSARGAARARGSTTAGGKGCCAASRRDGVKVVQRWRPGDFVGLTWFSPLSPKDRPLSIVFPLKVFFFPLKSLFFFPFCFIFPLWKFNLMMQLLASGLSLKCHVLPSPFCGLLRASLWSLWWDSVT